MNLLIVQEADFINAQQVELYDRRAEHLYKVLKAQAGDKIKTGLLNGNIGSSYIEVCNTTSSRLSVDKSTFKQAPVTGLAIHVLLAMPRPNMLRRSLRHMTELGIKNIHLFHADKVEKSFWQTPLLQPEKIKQELILGLEQSGDTLLPNVSLYPNFEDFKQRILDTIPATALRLLAHPYQAQACPMNLTQDCYLLIGPEGGFTQTEVDFFQQHQFTSIHIGQRILRVENAITALISRLAPWQ